MAPISRRTFLAATAAVVVGACSDDGGGSSTPPTSRGGPADPSVAPPSTTAAPADVELPSDPFTLGVASGDPDGETVVLWTRLAPQPRRGGGMPEVAVPVTWEISRRAEFESVHSSGIVEAVPEHGHSVHAIVELSGGDWYYRFRAGEYVSEVGRTRCAPAIGEPTERCLFAAASCQNFEHGFYAAHRDLVAQRPDFVVWLGDYIYEGAGSEPGPGVVRSHGTAEPQTLGEYRDRYALYRSDPDLRSAHATAPWFVIWDDHEVENNYAGLQPQEGGGAAAFATRRAAAYQAWWEHMPVRLGPPGGGDYRTYRNVLWGDLIGMTLLDGRQYRTDQACGDQSLAFAPPCPELGTPGRTMLGAVQREFLLDLIGNEATLWNVVANQTVMSDLTIDFSVLNYDQWDGYPAERAAILQTLADRAVPNVVVLTGDIHLGLVGQLRAGDVRTGAPVGVEFVSSSISSQTLLPAELPLDVGLFPALVDAELEHRGYVLHHVDRVAWIAEYRTVDDATDPASASRRWKAFDILADGSNTVRQLVL